MAEQREQLSEQEDWLTHWANLDVIPQSFSSHQTTVEMGTISVANATEFREALAKFQRSMWKKSAKQITSFYLTYVVLKTSASIVDEIATRYGFVKEAYPYEQTPKEQLQEIKQELQACYEAQNN